MSTTKSLKVYKGIPTIIKARAKGYWDEETVLTFDTAGESKSVSMSVYDGLNCEISDSASGVKVLDFSDTTLPYKWDYNSKLATSRYCLAPSGQSYDVAYYKYNNFTVFGSPTIDENGVASGFSGSNYIVTSTRFPTSFNTWEKVVCFTTSSDITTKQYIFSEYTDSGTIIGIYNSKLIMSASSGTTDWSIMNDVAGITTLSANTKYWVKMSYTGTQYITYLSTTGAFNGEETTENTTTNSTKITGGNYSAIGVQYYNGSTFQPFYGTVDLGETYIKVDGSIWWKTKSEYTYDNFTTTGSPTISADGIVSGFSRYNYISLPEIFNPGASTWEQQIKFTTGSSLSYSHQRLTGTPTDMKGGANIVIQSDKLELWLTSTNNSWNIYTGDYPSASILQTNTTYWVKLIFDGSKYVLSYSTDGTSFTDIITVNNSTAVTSTQAMSFGAGSGNSPFYGSIDLSESYINIDGSLWWKAGGKNIESLPGVLYDYTDDGSSVTLDCYANGDTSVILTDAASYNGTYLGTVNIPAHTAYVYNPNTGEWETL